MIKETMEENKMWNIGITTWSCRQQMHQLVRLTAASKHTRRRRRPGKPRACADPTSYSSTEETRLKPPTLPTASLNKIGKAKAEKQT